MTQEGSDLGCLALIITETYLSLGISLLIPGLFARTPKRSCLLAMSGVFCVMSETYLYFALPSLSHAPGVFECTFIVHSPALLVFILILASLDFSLLLVYLFVLFGKIGRIRSRSRHLDGVHVETEAAAIETEDVLGLPKDDRIHLSCLPLPSWVFFSIFS